ncbi:MAG: hypothetical protein ABIR36_15725, partial [Nitrospiraceae bacterium]
RASNEHILIVRVPRAGGRPGCPPPRRAGPSPHPLPVLTSPHHTTFSPFFRTPEFPSLLVKILPFPNSALRLLKHLANGRVDRE